MPTLEEVPPYVTRRLTEWAKVASLLPALTVGNRLLMLEMLRERARTVPEMAAELGHSEPVVAHQVATLKASGLVERDGEGPYSITPRGLKVVAALSQLVD